MKALRKLWAWLDGKKTKAGGIMTAITGLLYIVNGIWKGAIPGDVLHGADLISGSVLMTGVTHKIIKNNVVQKIQNAVRISKPDTKDNR